jgi:hypothetical protein
LGRKDIDDPEALMPGHYGENMNALDKIEKRRNPRAPGIVDDYGFPDQPMLDEMTEIALKVLDKNRYGFVLMVEGPRLTSRPATWIASGGSSIQLNSTGQWRSARNLPNCEATRSSW